MKSFGRRTILLWLGRAVFVVTAVVAVDAGAAVLLRAIGVLPTVTLSPNAMSSAEMILSRPFAQPTWRVADRPHTDRYVVGIFGGSLADQFARNGGMPALGAALTETLRPRRVEVINLAIPGGSQPAQLNLLAMSRHRIDAAVVLDGFNEVAVGGCDCTRAARFWAERGGRPAGELIAPAIAQVHRGIARFESRWRLRWSALAQIVWYRTNLEATGNVLDAFRSLPGMPALACESPSGAEAEVLAARWARCVEATNELAQRSDVTAVFFLQPNQRALSARNFTDAERQCCLRAEGRYEAIAARYTALDREVTRLHSGGIAISSLTTVFDTEPETVWRDECCHVNARGDEILSEVISARVADVLRGLRSRE